MRISDFDAPQGRQLHDLFRDLRELEEEPWLLPVKQISATQLNMLQRCPRQYQQRYVLGVKEAPGAARVLGSAFHGAHEHNWLQKIETHEDVATSELSEYYNDVAWPSAVDEVGGESEVRWDGDAHDTRSLGDKMVVAYRENVSPRIQPVAVEQKVTLDVGLPVPLLGYLDVLTEGPTIDTKTAKSKISKPKADWRLQGRVYRLLRPAAVDWHVVTKAKAPTTWTPLESSYLHEPLIDEENAETAEHVRRLARLANHYMTIYGDADPWPATGIGHDWACDWCAYRSSCPAWRGR